MKRITTTTGLVAISILAISTNATPAEFSYSYLEGNYLSIVDSSDGPGVDGEGLGVTGSFAISPMLAIGINYKEYDFDRVSGFKVDVTQTQIGLTAHTAISPNMDILGSINFLDAELVANDGFFLLRDDDTGYSAGIGLRYMLSNTVELNASLTGIYIFNDKSTELDLGARYYASDKLSFAAGYITADDDVSTVALSARYGF